VGPGLTRVWAGDSVLSPEADCVLGAPPSGMKAERPACDPSEHMFEALVHAVSGH